MFYTTPEEKAKETETIARVTEEFKAEFAAMMRKYKCEVRVAESTRGYYTTVDGIEFEFDGVYENGEVVRPYFAVNIGTWASGENI